ncbi:MAG: DMT family transporter [Patescibacteria group bacterium]|nr:DMT family transporter [Patescibacteria group bacterium]
MGIILAVITALLLGLSNVLLKKSFKDFVPSISFFILAIFSMLIWLPVGLVFGVQFDQWLLGLFVGFMSAILGQAIYIYVLEKGELSITATILSSFSIYTIIFSILFNKERPTPLTLLFILLTVLGTIIVSLPEKLNKKELHKVSFILWAVFAAICIGASDTLTKYYINRSSVGSFLFYVSFAQLIVSFAYLRLEKQPLNQFMEIANKFKDYKFALLGSLCIAVATMFLFLSFNFTLASIASPIAASAPVITVILALIFLKDKITVKNWIGLIMVLASIIGIGFITG